MKNKELNRPGSGYAEAPTGSLHASQAADRLMVLLERIREDQRVILEQQQKILSELADVKIQQKKMQQEMEGDLDPMDMLVSRNGLIQ